MKNIETNEYLVRISGKVAIEPKELNLGDDVDIVLKGSIIEIKHLDTQEGTQDKVYVIKPLEALIK